MYGLPKKYKQIKIWVKNSYNLFYVNAEGARRTRKIPLFFFLHDRFFFFALLCFRSKHIMSRLLIEIKFKAFSLDIFGYP